MVFLVLVLTFLQEENENCFIINQKLKQNESLKAPLQQIVALGEGLEHAIYLHTHVGWTEDTLDCCGKIPQPIVVKFIFSYNSWYLIYLNNKNDKVQITDSEFISNVFSVSDGQD